jgi:phage FluMu protein Com
MTHIWIPKVSIKENRIPNRAVKIFPSTVSSEFQWQCPQCKNMNLMNKSDVSSNHTYTCWSCFYNCTFNMDYVPEDINSFLHTK